MLKDKSEKKKDAQIQKLKAKLRKYYLQYHNALDGLDCGKTLGEYVSSRATRAKCAYNEVIDELVKLDPEAEKYRLT